MRAIRFRGMVEPKTSDRTWCFGDLIQYRHDKACIQYTDEEGYITIIRVNIETVGQFTGMHDNAGRAIYEGDIIEFQYPDRVEEAGFGTVRGEVMFQKGCFVVSELGFNYKHLEIDTLRSWLENNECVIIGNIHENKIN